MESINKKRGSRGCGGNSPFLHMSSLFLRLIGGGVIQGHDIS